MLRLNPSVDCYTWICGIKLYHKVRYVIAPHLSEKSCNKMNKDQSNEIVKKSKRLTFIDGLRAIACIMIVVYHGVTVFVKTINKNEDFVFNIIHYGYLGVSIFFVISGFVMAYSASNIKIWDVKTLINFFLRRMVRLTPPYHVSILIASVVYLIRIIITRHFSYFPDISTLLANLLYLQGFFNLADVNSAFWTIRIEIQFYLFFALIMFFSFQISKKLKIISTDICFFTIFSMSFIISLVQLYWDFDKIRIIFLPSWEMFALGVISFYIYSKKITFQHGILIFVLLLILIYIYPNEYLTCAIYTYLLLLIVIYRSKLTEWLNFPVIQFFGKISYSLYLVHWPIMGLTTGLSTRLGLAKHHFGGYISFLIAFALSTLVATVMYHLVEVPSINWSHRFKIKST